MNIKIFASYWVYNAEKAALVSSDRRSGTEGRDTWKNVEKMIILFHEGCVARPIRTAHPPGLRIFVNAGFFMAWDVLSRGSFFFRSQPVT